MLEERIVAQPRLQHAGLFGEGAIEQRLRLPAEIDPDRRDRKICLADIGLAPQVRLEPPVRQDRGPRIERDVAADVGALIERAPGEIAELLADRAAEQAAELARDVADLRADLAGEAERAVERRDHRHARRGGR